MGLKELLSRRNMRIANLGAVGLITVCWLIRFYYFTEREDIVEVESTVNGKKVTTLEKQYNQDNFWMILYTLAVLPILLFIFVMVEFQVKQERLAPICRHFFFLDYYTGKAFYHLLFISIII